MADAVAKARYEQVIRKNEGYRGNLYEDTKGNTTVGIGFNVDDAAIRRFLPQDVVEGKRKLTEHEAQIIFTTRILPVAKADAAAFVGPDVFTSLDPARQQALVDMAYNMGGPRLNRFVNMKAAIQKGDFQTAHNELLNSRYARELPQRAQTNAQRMLQGTPIKTKGK